MLNNESVPGRERRGRARLQEQPQNHQNCSFSTAVKFSSCVQTLGNSPNGVNKNLRHYVARLYEYLQKLFPHCCHTVAAWRHCEVRRHKLRRVGGACRHPGRHPVVEFGAGAFLLRVVPAVKPSGVSERASNGLAADPVWRLARLIFFTFKGKKNKIKKNPASGRWWLHFLLM